MALLLALEGKRRGRRGDGWASEGLDAPARHGCRGDPLGDSPWPPPLCLVRGGRYL